MTDSPRTADTSRTTREFEGTPDVTAIQRIVLRGAPTVPAERARVIVLQGEGRGRSVAVGAEATIGRDASCHLTLSESAVSRRHARIVQTDARGWMLEDLGSRNGTRVNGQQLSEGSVPLAFGDKIAIGNTILLFTHFDPEEEQIFHAQKLQSLGQLAGGVAHDVNNLVGSALVNVAYLRRGTLSVDEQSACLKDCEDALTRVVEIVRRLTGFARRGMYESRAVHLHALVEEAWRLTRHRGSNRVAVNIEIPSTLHVLGDATQLMQVATNLLANAVDAMPNGGLLAVRASAVASTSGGPHLADGDYVLLSVRDSGVGMSSEVLARVFEPFFTTKPTGHGTGLGLATVHGIVANHGGHIDVVSTPGAGTEFRVWLPAATSAGSDAKEAAPARVKTWRPSMGGAVRVLLADDEAVVLRSAQRLLGMAGAFDIVSASTGEDALRIFRQEPDGFGLVMLDVDMPGSGGVAAFQQMRELRPNVPVVLMSGSGAEEHVRELLNASGVSFLRKPYDLEALRSVIAAARWSSSAA